MAGAEPDGPCLICGIHMLEETADSYRLRSDSIYTTWHVPLFSHIYKLIKEKEIIWVMLYSNIDSQGNSHPITGTECSY